MPGAGASYGRCASKCIKTYVHWKLLLFCVRPYTEEGSNLVPSKSIPMAKIITSSFGVNTPKNQVRPAIVIETLKMLPWCKSSSSQQGACFSRGIMPENAYLCMRGRYLCRNNVCCSICCKTIFSSKLLYSNPNDSELPWDCGAEVFLLHTALSSVRPQIKRSQSKEDYKNTG